MASIVERNGKFSVRWRKGGRHRSTQFSARDEAERFLAGLDASAIVDNAPRASSHALSESHCGSPPAGKPDPLWWHDRSRRLVAMILEAVEDRDEIALSIATKAARAVASLTAANRQFLEDESIKKDQEQLRADIREILGRRKDGT
jgi:hypothetical protein